MTTTIRLQKYCSSQEPTDMQLFTNGDDAVVLHDSGDVSTFTSGCSEPLYAGSDMDEARESLELTQDEFDRLLQEPVEYLTPII